MFPMFSLQGTPSQGLTHFVVAFSIVSCLMAGKARAQTADPNMWITDGQVSAIATAGNAIYLGGSFTYVGPNTGHFVVIDSGTGIPEPRWPRVNGDVTCSAPDGTGGWYIGGSLTSVGSASRANLAHIRADKTLAEWDPDADGTGVTALAVS